MTVLSRKRPTLRSLAVAALLGASFLAGPSLRAHADDTGAAPMKSSPMNQHASAKSMESPGESIDQRISSLHAALKITPDEESSWSNVATAMRENAEAMQKLVAEKSNQPPANLTALDDLKTYEKFAQTHVDGLKNLISSFETLYDAMPDAQKKIADDVFRSQKNQTSHG